MILSAYHSRNEKLVQQYLPKTISMNSEVLLDRNFKRAVLTEIRDYRSLIDLKPKFFAVMRCQ